MYPRSIVLGATLAAILFAGAIAARPSTVRECVKGWLQWGASIQAVPS